MIIKKRVVKCEWQSVLMRYNYDRRVDVIVEVLASYDTREEANENQSKFVDRLNGTNYTLTIHYHEEILSEEVV